MVKTDSPPSRQVKWQHIILFGAILALALLSHIPLYQGQFRGEDEASQWRWVTYMITDIRTGDFIDLVKRAATASQPLLRYLLAIPGVALSPNTEFGFRIAAILCSLYMTYQVYKLGTEVGGEKVGFVSAALIAISGVYNWTSMAFGWGILGASLIHCLRLLRTQSLDLERPGATRTFLQINLFVLLGFLVNTGFILFFVTTGILYLLYNYRRLWRLIKLFAPFVAFYALYYFLYFYAIPYIAATYFDRTDTFGQLGQNLVRARLAYLNYTSLIENLQGINGYFFPYVAWIFLGCAIYYLARHKPIILLWLSLYTVAWSIYFTNQSQQYFLLVFIAIFPFGVKVIYDKLNAPVFNVSMVVLAILMALWNYQIFIRPYGSDDPNFPTRLLNAGYATLLRQHNVVEPYDQIAAEIESTVDEGKFYVNDISGAFHMFYYQSDKFAQKFWGKSDLFTYDQAGNCYQIAQDFSDVEIVVTQKEICPASGPYEVLERRTYPKSDIRLFVIGSGG